MKPIIYHSSATSLNNLGLGALSDAISCVVSEERNGEYELTMEYPVGGIHFDEIGDRAIICAIPSPYRTPQPFRIYFIESPLNGVVTIHAHHLSYDLSGIPVSPFTAGSCSQALSGLVTNSVVTNPFSTWTDKSVIGEYKLSVPTSFRACLGGQEGSILDIYGKGEYEFDKYAVKLHLNRGSDNGVKIAYGKNLTDFNMERNLETIVTGIFPYWANIDEDDVVEGDIITIYDINNPAYLIDSGGAYLLDSGGKYLLVQNPFPFDNVLPLDLSSDFEEKPTKEELKARAEKYITDNGLGVPRVSIDVSFVQLEQTEEYKDVANLEAVDLCDTVTVEFPMYGISAKAKIISIETDVLLERYTSVQIGDTRPSLADTLAHLETNSVTKNEIKIGNQKAADYINNTKGTFEWIDNGDGTNGGFTIFENDDESSWLRCTAGGLGISSDGGLTYTNAITKDGVTASQIYVRNSIGEEILRVFYDDPTQQGWIRLNNPVTGVYGFDVSVTQYGSGLHLLRVDNGAETIGLSTVGSTTSANAQIHIDDPDTGFPVFHYTTYREYTNGNAMNSLTLYQAESDPNTPSQDYMLAAVSQYTNGNLQNRFDFQYANGGGVAFRLMSEGANNISMQYKGHTVDFRTITINGTTYHLLGY